MANKLIKTSSGLYRSPEEVIKINNSFYVKGLEAVLVGNNYKLISDPGVYYCPNDLKFKPKVDKDKDLYYITGYFLKKPVYSKAECKEILIGEGSFKFKEYHLASEKYKEAIDPTVYTQLDSDELLNLEVYGKDTSLSLHSKINRHKKNYFIPKEEVNWEELSDYTWGIEFEADRNSKRLNLKSLVEYTMYPVRDGSLDGGVEYITDIINSSEMLQKLKGFCRVAYQYLTPANSKGNLHAHVGNVNFSKKEFVAFYMLYYKIQEDLTAIMPYSQRTLRYLADKNRDRDYCKPLPNLKLSKLSTIEEKFNRIWTWMCEGNPLDEDNNPDTPNHPREGEAKYRWKCRYYAVNLIPYYFGQGTIEFRSHFMTFDYREIIAWLLICKSIIDFAKKNTEKCISFSKIDLSEVLEISPRAKELEEYTASRLANYISSEYVKANLNSTSIKYITV